MTITPDLQPDVDLKQLAMIAAANPLVIGLGLYLGRRCDQAAKLVIAGFAAGLAGMVLIWLAAFFRMPFIYEPGRAAAGIFVVQMVFGMMWAGIGYWGLKGAGR